MEGLKPCPLCGMSDMLEYQRTTLDGENYLTPGYVRCCRCGLHLDSPIVGFYAKDQDGRWVSRSNVDEESDRYLRGAWNCRKLEKRDETDDRD